MRYSQIRSMDISNGEGVGVALFVQGCYFHCKGCFNTDTWDFEGGKEWTNECTIQLLKLIENPYIKRISILGGEPLTHKNVETILKLTSKIRNLFPEKTIWVYTGFTWEEIWNLPPTLNNPATISEEHQKIIQTTMNYIDILVDGRFIESKKDLSLAFRGSRNQRIIDVQKSIREGKVCLKEF